MALGPRINHLAWHSISRRHFLGAAAATAGALATGLRIPNVLADNDELATVFPLPIPGTFQPFTDLPAIHHFPPVLPNDGLPIDEPSEITDFNGVVGTTRVTGSGVSNDGHALTYQVDNGFMSGLYRGEDGRMHHGTFAFIWMDLFSGAGSTKVQVHDFNPGIRQPGGLFWTVPVSEDSLEVDLEDGTATLALDDFDTDDYSNLRNALAGGQEVDASISFKMKWTAHGDAFNVSDPVHTFAGRYRFANVGIAWSAAVPSAGFSFTSDPSSNVTVVGVFGRERNGMFFSGD